MNINREAFLNALEHVRFGLSPKETIQQASCFVFQKGWIVTYNDEVSCRIKFDLGGLEGAVQAKTLLAVLHKIPDETLTVDAAGGELCFIGGERKFGLTMEAEVLLPIDKIEKPKDWSELTKGMIEGIGSVQHCASDDESRFVLTCIHLTPESVEASDGQQAMRYAVETGLEGKTLVRSEALAPIVSLSLDEVCVCESWLHFRGESGLIYSCRKYDGEFPNLTKVLEVEGKKIEIPKGTKEAIDKANIFAQDTSRSPLIRVTFKKGKVRFMGEGLSGWYSEVKTVSYDGEELDFSIRPDLLKYISEHYREAIVGENRIKVSGESWEYVSVLAITEE